MQVINASDFGKLIHKARRQAKLTQSQLAAAAGLGERFIRELEKGKTTCQLEKALLVARMLGVKLDMQPPPSDE